MTDLYIANDNALELSGLVNEIAAATTGKKTLTVATAETITRADGGDFTADGFLVGQEVRTTGFPTAANNGTWTVSAVVAATLTINEACLVAEAGDGCERIDGYSYQNSATVTVTLLDRDEAEVSGETWPLSMSYIASSSGVYRATLSKDLVLTKNRPYTARVLADAGLGLVGRWDFALTAAARTA